MKRQFCLPCFLEIKKAGKHDIERVRGGVNMKITCWRCKRRRFGAEYEISRKGGAPVTTTDLKRAFMDERPVRYNGITYQRVTAVIYRKTPDKTGLLVQGELLDKNGRAVMIAAAERIEVEEPK